MVKKTIFSYAWRHISMSNAFLAFHYYSVILGETFCVFFHLNSFAIKTIYPLLFGYSCHQYTFVVCQVKTKSNCQGTNMVFAFITGRICQRIVFPGQTLTLYWTIYISKSVLRCTLHYLVIYNRWCSEYGHYIFKMSGLLVWNVWSFNW